VTVNVVLFEGGMCLCVMIGMLHPCDDCDFVAVFKIRIVHKPVLCELRSVFV